MFCIISIEAFSAHRHPAKTCSLRRRASLAEETLVGSETLDQQLWGLQLQAVTILAEHFSDSRQKQQN